jgi:hypothetical protein
VAITIHYIDEEWNLVSTLLSCKHLPGLHDAPSLATFYRKEVAPYEVHVRSIVLDNASSAQLSGELFLGSDGDTMQCIAHLLQLVVGVLLTDVDCKSVIQIVHDIVVEVRVSSVLRDRLAGLQRDAGQQELELILDVVTRWSSTYKMIARFLNDALLPVVLKMVNEGSIASRFPSPNEQALLKSICSILQPFHDATTLVNGSEYLTLHLVPGMLGRLLASIQALPDLPATIGRLKKNLQDDLEYRLERAYTVPTDDDIATVSLPLKAAALHPSTADLSDFSPAEKARIRTDVITEALQLHRIEHNMEADEEIEAESVIRACFDYFFRKCDRDGFLQTSFRAVEGMTLKQWLDNYFSNLSSIFPVMRAILCVCATSAPCERVFSSAGFLDSDHRARLNDDTLAAQIMVRDCIITRYHSDLKAFITDVVTWLDEKKQPSATRKGKDTVDK